MTYRATLNSSYNGKRLYILLLLLPFSYQLETPCTLTLLNQKKYSKKLISAYVFYIAFAKEYANTFKKIISTSEKSAYWHILIHETVLNTHNASQDQEEHFLIYKENSNYQELPYLYFKKNLTAAKKKIFALIKSLNTPHTIEQSSITHCLNHIVKQIEALEKAIIKMPEYYQEQIKIASKKENFITHFVQSGIGFVVKKWVPFF